MESPIMICQCAAWGTKNTFRVPDNNAKMLPLKLAGVLGGDPIGQLLGQGQQWRDVPLSPQLRLPALYGLSPMGGDPVYGKPLVKDRSTNGYEVTSMILS